MGVSEGLASVKVTNGGILVRRWSQWMVIIEEVFSVPQPWISEQSLDYSGCMVQSLTYDSPRNWKLYLLVVGVLVAKIVAFGQFSEHSLPIYVSGCLIDCLQFLDIALLPNMPLHYSFVSI